MMSQCIRSIRIEMPVNGLDIFTARQLCLVTNILLTVWFSCIVYCATFVLSLHRQPHTAIEARGFESTLCKN